MKSDTHSSKAAVSVEAALLNDLRSLIDEARSAVAVAVNAGLTMLYWRVGKRINEEILGGERAEYGEKIVHAVSAQLQAEYGRSFSEKSLRRMLQFAEVLPDGAIVATLSRQLSWSHFKEIIPLKDPLQREFYTEMCRIERWSVRTLRERIGSMLYERTAISRKPEETIRQELAALRDDDRLSADLVFRDPYVLDFLNLKDTWSEKDLEASILRELESFLLELGAGFSFVARQKRMTIDNEDFYLDLLFYHRRLKRLVAVELKLEKFKAADKGQMELYLRWLERYEMEPGEAAPIGLILCAEGSHEQIELLRLEETGMRVAEYLTELPARELLQAKLHAAVQAARARMEEGGAAGDEEIL
jgi:predicted nuclease of restriction endonuclease-like (RecB) superfamily